MIVIGKTKKKTATRCGGDEEDGGRGAETEEVEIEMEEEEITVVSKEVRTENIKEVETEITKEMRTKNSEKVERGMREENFFDKIPTSSGSGEPGVELEVEFLKPAMKK